METDEKIKEFIDSHCPEVSDGEKFLDELESKLALMDQARTIYGRKVRQSNGWIVAAFCVGVLFGAACFLTILFDGGGFELFKNFTADVFRFVTRFRFLIMAAVISVLAIGTFVQYTKEEKQ